MTSIWRNDGPGWQLLAPTRFPDEATLHTLVEQAPHILPLSGSTSLTIVGREVQLGNGAPDLLAVEPSGQRVVIEIKLLRNAEARRAVVAQAFTYAAHLRGLDPKAVEQQILGPHLRRRGHESLAGAVAANDQEGSFDPTAFAQGLADSLTSGSFRIVFVLDDAPEELVRLVGYLESISNNLVINLIKVSAYDIEGSQILVPQRLEPKRVPSEVVPAKKRPASGGRLTRGADVFLAAIDQAPPAHQPLLRQLAAWALDLEREGLVELSSYQGQSGILTLLPRLPGVGAGLVTIWNDGGAYLSFWRSVFERHAPASIARVEQAIAPAALGQGTYAREITDERLEALTDAYREAARGQRTR
ncbi:MAG: hypothetical protein QJR03_02160 [Sphaerobacter sp.]|nr:hypothetical protein [Sphaerobacter sp.]